MNNLVSVVMPAYNHEKYVQGAIESIINQIYKNIELIVIDDGSKDSTWEKIQELKAKCEERFFNVHFETKENEGMCATLNKMITLAQGEYIYIIASDDLAKPEAIETELEFLMNNPDYSLCVGNNDIIDMDGNIAYWDEERHLVYDETKAKYKTTVEYIKTEHNYFNNEQFGLYSTLCDGNYIPNGYLIRKSIYEKTGLYPVGPYLEDWWFNLQLSKYAKMKYIDKVLFSYRWHDSNAVKNNEKMYLINQNVRILEDKIIKNIDTDKVNPETREVIKNGVIYKRIGIPYFIEFIKSKNSTYKIKTLKLFNIKIFQHKKLR